MEEFGSVRDGSGATVGRLVPGLVVVAAGVGVSYATSKLLGFASALTVAVLFGALVRNVGALPARSQLGLSFSAKRLLRVGVVLLGLQLSVPALLELRPADLAVVTVTVLVTFTVTRMLGRRLGLSGDESLLMATGFAICGAAAIAAVSSVTDPDHKETATSVALVTLYGTIAIAAFPPLQRVLDLTDHQFGIWAGASIHEVGQVVAAAAVVGEHALLIAVVAKLARVVYLAPMVVIISLTRRRRAVEGTTAAPVVPMFVAGFVAAAALRNAGVVPPAVLDVAQQATTGLLTAAMFALGTAIHLPTLARSGVRAAALGAVATLLAAVTAYVGIRTLS